MFADTPEKIDRVVRMLGDSVRVGVDTEYTAFEETPSEHPWKRDTAVSIQFSCRGEKVEDVPWSRYIFVPNWGEHKGNLRPFKRFLEDSNRVKVLHSAKHDYHPLRNAGVNCRGLKSDTMVKAYLHDTSKLHGLKERVFDHLGVNLPDYREVFKAHKTKKNGDVGKQTYIASLAQVLAGGVVFEGEDEAAPKREGIKRLVEYAVKDPYITLLLDDYLDKELSNTEWTSRGSMLEYYTQFEVEYTELLFEMECTGCLLDEERFERIQGEIEKDVIAIEKAFFKECVKFGVSPSDLENVNLGSSPQVGKLLTNLGVNTGVASKKTRKMSVNKAALGKVRGKHKKLIDILSEYKGLRDNLLGTFVTPALNIIRWEPSGGRIRTFYKQTGTKTFRLSSSNENQQNVPTSAKDKYGIREGYLPDEGCDFADIDLEQAELRLTAHFSQEPALLDVFKRGLDPHSRTAIEVYPSVKKWVNGRKITKEILEEIKEKFPTERKYSKNVVFMILYGGGAGRYNEMTGAGLKEGQRVIDMFFRGYPGLDRWMKSVLRGCRNDGHIRSLLRRYIHVPDIASSDFKIRGHAERQAVNFKIQGSCADLLKMAMLLIHRDEKLKKWGVKFPLQIHDELAGSIPKGLFGEVKPIVDGYVSSPFKHFGLRDLAVETPASLSKGNNWKEAK